MNTTLMYKKNAF